MRVVPPLPLTKPTGMPLTHIDYTQPNRHAPYILITHQACPLHIDLTLTLTLHPVDLDDIRQQFPEPAHLPHRDNSHRDTEWVYYGLTASIKQPSHHQPPHCV